jgi:hypothetical protein
LAWPAICSPGFHDEIHWHDLSNTPISLCIITPFGSPVSGMRSAMGNHYRLPVCRTDDGRGLQPFRGGFEEIIVTPRIYYVVISGLTGVRNEVRMQPQIVVEPWGLSLRIPFIRGAGFGSTVVRTFPKGFTGMGEREANPSLQRMISGKGTFTRQSSVHAGQVDRQASVSRNQIEWNDNDVHKGEDKWTSQNSK